MDESQSTSDELQKLQSNITALFESLVNEKNKLKHEKDKSASYVETLVNEVSILRKENELLRKSNNEKRRACETCVELKEKFIIQNWKITKLENNFKKLRKFINEVPYEVAVYQFQETLIRLLDGFECDDSQGRLPVYGANTNLFRSANKSSTRSLTEEQAYETVKKSPNSNEFNLDGYVRNSNEKINDEQPKEQKNSEDVEVIQIKTEEGEADINAVSSESKRCVELIKDEFHTPRKANKYDTDFIDSPFFSLPTKKGEGSPILFNKPQGPSPNQFKRKASEIGSLSPGKVVEKKLFLKSPNQKTYKSPAKGSKSKYTSHLRFTNSVEAEISLGGVRKLKQTQLNLEFYKSKNNEENSAYPENIGDGDIELNDDENKFGEDDLILGSPKQPANSFDEFMKNFRIREQENDRNQFKSIGMSVIDPDETFVHSTYLKESMRKVSEESKSTPKTPPKAPSRSPEYNSVPFPYKGSPVRKKSERMKLPGQMCMECHKYYKAILGEIDQERMQEILNQCSKHRDKHYNLVQTPPGYWKPYLTATMDLTMQDDDTCVDEYRIKKDDE